MFRSEPGRRFVASPNARLGPQAVATHRNTWVPFSSRGDVGRKLPFRLLLKTKRSAIDSSVLRRSN